MAAKQRVIIPLAILMLCIITSYTSAKRLLKQHNNAHKKSSWGSPFGRRKRGGRRKRDRQKTPFFKPFKGRPAPKASHFRRPFATLPFKKGSIPARPRPVGKNQKIKPQRMAEPQSDLEKGILLFMEAEIAPIAEELSQAIGGKEMQAAAKEQGQKKQTRGTFGKFSPRRSPFGRSSTRKPFTPFGRARKRPPFGGSRRSPFGRFRREAGGFGARRPSGKSPLSFGRPGAGSSFKGYGKPSSSNFSGAKQTTRLSLKPNATSSSSKAASTGGSEQKSSSSGIAYTSPEKDDKQKEHLNKVRNIRQGLNKKMKEVNAQFSNPATRKEAQRQLENTLMASFKEKLEELKKAKDNLNNKQREKLRKQSIKIETYKKFLIHMLHSFPKFALGGSDALKGFELLFHEIEESVGAAYIKTKGKEFLTSFIQTQQQLLKKRQKKEMRAEVAQEIIKKIEAVKRNYPASLENIVDLDRLLTRAKSVASAST